MKIFFFCVLALIFLITFFLFSKFCAEIKYFENHFEIKIKSGIFRFKLKFGKKQLKKDEKKVEKSSENSAEKLFKDEGFEGICKLLKKYKPLVLNVFKVLSNRIEIRNCRIRLCYGTGDAAHTGILYGIIQIVAQNLFAAAVSHLKADYPKFEVEPNFEKSCFCVEFGGIIKARPVHIIIAYLKFLKELKKINKKR